MILWVFAALVLLFVILPLIGAAISWVIWTALVGIFLGGLARLIIPGRQNIGVLATIVCGWVGSLVGGGVWGFHHNHHEFARVLIEIGVSAVAVLLWSRTHRYPPSELPGSSTSSGRRHRVIDI
jgi:uncharacterized membrane protein YeaQ/YmgE (transglycosylase-associated protein family)